MIEWKIGDVTIVVASMPDAALALMSRSLKDFRHEWIWAKSDGTHEHVLVFGKVNHYNPISDRNKEAAHKKRCATISPKAGKPKKGWGWGINKTNNSYVSRTVKVATETNPSSVQCWNSLVEVESYMRKTYSPLKNNKHGIEKLMR